MNSFTYDDGTVMKEPENCSTWGQNIVNIISDPIFNPHLAELLKMCNWNQLEPIEGKNQ